MKKLKIIISIIVSIIVVISIVVATIIVFNTTNNYKKYLQIGDYEKAYSIAKKGNKTQVLKENTIAYVFKTQLGLQNIYLSPKIINAWCNEKKDVVICFNSENYSSKSYICYTYDESKVRKYEFLCLAIGDIRKDTISTGYENKLNNKQNSALKSSAYNIVSTILKDEYKLEDTSITNINNLFSNGNLKDIKLINSGKLDYKRH